MSELWRYIPGFEGRYSISSEGRVKSLPRFVRGGNGSVRFVRERILKQNKDKDGYLTVTLRKLKPKRSFLIHIHRAVASAFLGPRPEGLVVDHIDNDRLNNSPYNLRYTTVRINSSKDRCRVYKLPTGVYVRSSGRYQAQKRIGGKSRYLGTFDTVEEARNAYENANMYTCVNPTFKEKL